MTDTAWLALDRYGIVLGDIRARQMARKLRSVEDMPAAQAYLHIGHEDSTGSAAQMRVQCREKIAADQVVPVAGPALRVDFATAVFMPNLGVQFAIKVCIDADGALVDRLGHNGILNGTLP